MVKFSMACRVKVTAAILYRRRRECRYFRSFLVAEVSHPMLKSVRPADAAMAGLVALGAYTLLRAVARNAPLYSRAARRVFTSGAARATVKRKRAEVASAVADAEAWLAEAGGAPMPELRAAVSRSTIDELVRLQSHGMVTALDILKCFVANAIASHRRTNCLTFIDARAAAVAAARADEYRRAGNALPRCTVSPCQ
jgi:hypothetical protein